MGVNNFCPNGTIVLTPQNQYYTCNFWRASKSFAYPEGFLWTISSSATQMARQLGGDHSVWKHEQKRIHRTHYQAIGPGWVADNWAGPHVDKTPDISNTCNGLKANRCRVCNLICGVQKYVYTTKIWRHGRPQMLHCIFLHGLNA